ncbi:Flp family type IVb pilin [Devosia sp. Root685]|uniref:Flp family type IVb pilin n=1 Tax=Devosia sp. Root685 TaxID=1736587 RepID=UPI002A4E28FE|nr:Flp family type IVb pilin [Devosia sp. Root685]
MTSKKLSGADVARVLRRLKADESGATAIEYGLIAGLIAVVIIASLLVVNDNVTAMYDLISDALNPALSGAS